MLKITGIASLSSEFTPEYANVQVLELQGPAFGGGGFGDVYDLVTVNGAPPPTQQIVKVLRDNGQDSARRGFETIEKLQRKILDDNVARRTAGDPPIQALPALRALPQFSFRGQMGPNAVFGYSADRLDTAGYHTLEGVLEPAEPARARYVSELPLEDRLILAYELAEGMQALRRLSYIHADINPPNLFVNIAECHVALIDFDSGAVTDDPNESPMTFGKKAYGEWVAPEIMDQLRAQGSGPRLVRVDRFTDDWALTVGIHYLLFLCGPFFVLERSSSKCIRDYATRFGWPGFVAGDPLFASGIEKNHADYKAMLAELPAPVQKRMSDALNGGAVEPGRRALPYQWMMDLRPGREPLEILLFQADPENVPEGRPVRLTWRVAGARWVEIDQGIGGVGEAGSVEVHPAQGCAYTLTAETRGGQRLTETVYVRVFPLPRLRTLWVPAPALSRTPTVRDLRVPAPTLAFSAPTVRVAAPTIRLGAPFLRVPPASGLAVRFRGAGLPGPTPAARGPGWGRAGWLPSIGSVLGLLYGRLRSEIKTRFGGNP